MSSAPVTKGSLDLLLIGKTGNGKSATGNTILKRKSFKSVPSSTSVTKSIQSEYSEVHGRVIKVVDGPGVGDTDMKHADALQLVLGSVQEAIAANPEGYHAFLLVVRFGGRFTAEDIQTVSILKSIFGDDFVMRYCILVVTCGDNFDPEETETVSFESWCLAQKGVFRNLVDECNRRVILLDNRTKDPVKQTEQLEKLFAIVDSLSALGMRYSGEHFKMAQRNRDRLIVESKVPIIKEESFRETSLIIQQLGKVQVEEDENQLAPLEELKKRVDLLFKSVEEQDKGTGALKAVIANVKHVKECVDEQASSAKQSIEIKRESDKRRQEIERLRKEREQRRRCLDEEKRQELEQKMDLMETENRELQKVLLAREADLKQKALATEEEYRKVKEDETYSTIVTVGQTLLQHALPLLFKMIGQLSIEDDDSCDE